jgi:hypothetical protein
LSAGAGWKGRAQQIAALRDKITKLNIQFQQQQQQQQEPHNHGQPYRNRHPGGTTHQPEMSLVDKQDPLWQQQQSLEKHRQRQQLQHAQTELAVYQGKYEALNTKFQSLKTRNG